MTKVLVFEGDEQFASQMRTQLEGGGFSVTIVDDATVGLQQAANDRPDVILLSIELPRMNGYSVCNKIRRSPELKDIPLIIMSTDPNQEIFEQHRRLRTHADEYLHKPINLLELQQHVQRFAGASNGRGDSDATDLMMDEEVELDDDELEGAIELDEAELEEAAISEGVRSSPQEVDEEVDAFTENAFDALLDEGAYAPRAAASAQPDSLAQPESYHQPAAESEADAEVQLDSEPSARMASAPAPIPSTHPESAPALSSQPMSLSPVSKERTEQLEDELTFVREHSEKLVRENQRLASELDDANARAKHATGSTSGSAREILDLRERLNQKEKELLDLRDQQMQKEKELLHARDASLVTERANADLSDKVIELEKQVTSLERNWNSSKADKELAAKRADDYKRKVERLTDDLQTERETIAQLHADHETKLTDLRTERDLALAELNQELERTRAQAQEQQADAARAHAEQIERLMAEAADHLAGRERELRQESDEALGKAFRSHKEELNALKAEHASAVAKLEEQLAALEAEKQEIQRVLTDTQESLKAEQDKSARAYSKWQDDRGSLDRAKDALAAALARIEEVEARVL